MAIYMGDAVRFLNMGDCAFTVELADSISRESGRAVAALDSAVAEVAARGKLPGLTGTTRTFRSLTFHYDPLETRQADLEQSVRALLSSVEVVSEEATTHWRLPVSYEGDDAPDLAEVAKSCGMTVDAVVDAHTGADLVVYMLGFLPGFPFMGDLPESLHLPRRAEPRVRVPAGSVAMTGPLTAIYPWESPGGWNLIGRCPVPLFNPAWAVPALLAPNDHVRFVPQSAQEVAALGKALAAGEIAPTIFREIAG